MKRKLTFILVITLLFQLTFVSAAPKKADTYFITAQSQLANGKYTEAIKNLDEAIKLSPKTSQYHLLKGSALVEMKRYQEAIVCFDTAFGLNIKSADASYFKGKALILLEKKEDALKSFDAVLSIITKYPTEENKKFAFDTYLQKGDIFLALGKLNESVWCYDKAISLDGKAYQPYNGKALALQKLNKLDEVIQCYMKVTELQPQNGLAHYNLGLALQNTGNYTEALSAYEKAIQFKFDNMDVMYNRAACYAALYKTDEAISLLKQVTAVAPKYIEQARESSEFINLRGNSQFLEIVGPINLRGNTLGNIHSGGNVAFQGDWVYLSFEKHGTWKEKTDGSGKQKICEEYADELNVVGDWLYCNLFNIVDNDGFEYKCLGFYKIKTDGSQKIKLYDKRLESVNVVGEWIYYCSEDEGAKPYRMKIDGSNRKHILPIPTRCISVVDDRILYQNGADASTLYRMNLDGRNNQKLGDIGSYRLDINVSGDYIYFLGDFPNTGMYKVKKDGTDLTKMLEDQVSYMNIVDDWIYYIVFRDGLYKMKTDGNEKQKLYTGDIFSINIVGDWIYFGQWKNVPDTEREGYYKIKTNGSSLQPVVKYE